MVSIGRIFGVIIILLQITILNAQSLCEDFDAFAVPSADRNHAFNIYGNGNSGFLQNWNVVSGTPAIYSSGAIAGVNAYNGSQFALQAVCDAGPNWAESVALNYNFQQGQSYTVSLAIRNTPSTGAPTPVNVDFVLLSSPIAYSYNPNTGCSVIPAIPGNALTVHSISNFNQNSWQVVSFVIPTLAATYSQLWIRPGFSSGQTETTTYFLTDSLCINQVPTATCYSFDDVAVPFADRQHAFNIYGNGHAGFLQDWRVSSGTPAIEASGDITGVNAYDGNQYTLMAVCNLSGAYSEGLTLDYNFAQSQAYTVSMAVRNVPLSPNNATPIDVDFILLPGPISYTYNAGTGCSATPAIPGNALTVHSISSLALNSWQVISFNISNLSAAYTQLWIRCKFSTGASLPTTFFCFDSMCIAQGTCNLQVNLGNDTALCPGQPVALNGTTPGGLGYLWSNGFTGPVLNTSTPGAYTVRVTGTGGCTATDSVTITTISAPAALLLGNDTLYCGSFTRVLSTGVSTTHWNTGAVASQITVNTSGTYWAMDSNQCGSAADTIVISQAPIPAVDLGSDTSTCGPLMLNAGAANSYLWSTGAGTQTILVNTAATYSVTVANTYGCTAADNIIVTAGNITATASAVNTNCGLNNGQAQVAAAGTSPYTYLWSNGSNAATINNLAPGNYTVTVTDARNCSATAAVTINPSLNPTSITADKTTLCTGDSARICALQSYQAYQWNTGDTTACIRGTLAGNYYVTVTDAGNCTASSNIISLVVLPPPPVSVTINGDTLSVYNVFACQWLLNGSPINGATQPSYVIATPGNYQVMITDTNGCTAVSNPIVFTGIASFDDVAAPLIFPNPVTGNSWQIRLPDNQTAYIQLWDNNGNLLAAKPIEGVGEVNLPLPAGVYFVKIITGKSALTRKLIKL